MVSERNLIRIRTLDALLRELEDRPAIERKPFLKGMALAGRERVPSIRTYYRWRRVWLASGRDPESLRDRRQFLHGGKRAAFDPEALAFFCQRFLSTSKPTATAAYQALAVEAELKSWSVPSQITVTREIDRRIPRPLQDLIRGGLLAEFFPEQGGEVSA